MAGQETETPPRKWREEGVLLGYHSGPYSQWLLRPGRAFHQPASQRRQELPTSVPTGATAIPFGVEVSDPLTEPGSRLAEPLDTETLLDEFRSADRPARYDPIARERFTQIGTFSALHSDADEEQQGYAESLITHEEAHRHISNVYPDIYGKQRLMMYRLTIDILSGVDISDIPRLIVKSCKSTFQTELAQEARALHTQAKFLHNQVGPAYAEEFRQKNLAPVDQVRDDIERGSEPTTELDPHDVAFWLFDEGLSHWDIPLREIAFRVIDGSKRAHADGVLFEALNCEAEEVANASPAQQLDILMESIENLETATLVMGGSLPQLPDISGREWNAFKTAAATNGLGTDSTPSQQHHDMVGFEFTRAVDNKFITRLPLLVRDYPGQYDEVNLWNILSNLYVTRVGGPSGEIRQLLIDPLVYEWTKGTDLLRMAIDLWRFREHTLMPIVRTITHNVEYGQNDLVTLVRVGKTDGNYDFSDVTTGRTEPIDSISRSINEVLPKLREEYDHLREQLRKLGLALLEQDSAAVARYL